MILENKKNYLKVDDVQNGDTVTFLDEGQWIESTKFKYEDGTPRKQAVFSVMFKTEEKDMNVNATSRNALKAAWGQDTSLWVGKVARIELVKQNIGGSLRNVIYLSDKPYVDASDFGGQSTPQDAL